MSKTPITDKIQKILRIIEKVTLPTTLDTGADNSNFTKNWAQSGEDFEKFTGVDKFKKKYGDTIVIDASESGIGSMEERDLSNKVRSVLFSTPDVKNHRVSLLHVHKASEKIVPEGFKPSPYMWSTTAFKMLMEASSPHQVSPVLGDFYRMSPTSDEVSVRSAKFGTDFFFSSALPINKLGQFLHSDNGSFPRQLPGAGGTLQTYATANYQDFLNEAVEAVKQFVNSNDEDSLYALNELKTTSFNTLPSFIHDAILVGITDAANTNIYKDNRSKSDIQNKVGCSVLQPTNNVLAGLESIASIVSKPDELPNLTPELVAGLTQKLEQVKTFANPYNTADKQFLTNLYEAIKLRKWDVSKATGKTTTMLYFALSLIINKINKAFTSKPPSKDESAFYFGELGLGSGGVEAREKALFDNLIKYSLDSGDAPMAILRGKAGKKGDDNKFVIVPFVINYLAGKNETPIVGTLTQAGLTTTIHNYIYSRAATVTGASGRKEATKQDYIKIFSQVQENSSSILNARYGKNYWIQILDTCYNAETDTFRDGIFFVGLSPLFWDTVEGKEIYVSYNKSPEEFKISLPYMITDPNDSTILTPLNIMYEETSAAAIYCDRVIHITRDTKELEALKLASKGGDNNAPEGSVAVKGAGNKVPLPELDPRIKDRTESILNNPKYNFVSLSEIRKELLTTLYTNKDSEFSELSEICKNVIHNIIATVGNGFWSPGKENLALYNPWIIGQGKKRFEKANTNSQIMEAEKKKAIKAYLEQRSGL